MNRYVTGIKRGHHHGMDGSYIRCCEIDYKAPLKGIDPLPTSYKTDDGKYSFKTEKDFWISESPFYYGLVKSSDYGKNE